MNEQQVKDFLFSGFLSWMRGQTVGIDAKGETDYYTSDVERFSHTLKSTEILD